MREQVIPSPGQTVRLRSALGEIERRVVRVTDTVVVICTDTEYRQAQQELREPLGVGFKLSDVLSVVPAPTPATDPESTAP